jgi:hypothetical protein
MTRACGESGHWHDHGRRVARNFPRNTLDRDRTK